MTSSNKPQRIHQKKIRNTKEKGTINVNRVIKSTREKDSINDEKQRENVLYFIVCNLETRSSTLNTIHTPATERRTTHTKKKIDEKWIFQIGTKTTKKINRLKRSLHVNCFSILLNINLFREHKLASREIEHSKKSTHNAEKYY